MSAPAPVPPLEWDEAKRQRTLAERGVDFAAFGVFRDGRPFVERPDPRHGDEARYLRFARFDGRLFVVVWTPRGAAVRIISARLAGRRERREFGPRIPIIWRVSESRRTGGTMAMDWAKIDATTDEDIARQIAEDPDTAPELTDEMMRTAWLVVDGVRRPLVLPPADNEPPADRQAAGEG